MADGSKTAKKRNKKDPAVAARNTAKNRSKRVARDLKAKAEKFVTKAKRASLRRKGALARIERRILAERDGATCTRLNQVKSKIERSQAA